MKQSRFRWTDGSQKALKHKAQLRSDDNDLPHLTVRVVAVPQAVGRGVGLQADRPRHAHQLALLHLLLSALEPPLVRAPVKIGILGGPGKLKQEGYIRWKCRLIDLHFIHNSLELKLGGYELNSFSY